MAAILGISGLYHDSAAALVVDGDVVAAAEQERFSRKKHDSQFPRDAIRYCLDAGGIKPQDITFAVFYERPALKLERMINLALRYSPQSSRLFARGLKDYVSRYFDPSGYLRDCLRVDVPLWFCPHHVSHAASAFYPSPFEEAAIVTLDGVGEWTTSAIGYGQANSLTLLREIRYPHSLGFLYSAITEYCGFRIDSGEYKLMGLSAYGCPRYEHLIRQNLVSLSDDGSFHLNLKYFGFHLRKGTYSKNLSTLLRFPPRQDHEPMQQVYADLAASIQSVCEDVVLRTVRHARKLTGSRYLVTAGGVALNCLANARVRESNLFSRTWTQPAAGDSGAALGAALMGWFTHLKQQRAVVRSDSQHGSLLGPQYSDAEMDEVLRRNGMRYRRYRQFAELCHDVAVILSQNCIVGWFQGRMEFGPRALGARSILASPIDPFMQRRLNKMTKMREDFRPFAPAVLAQEASKWFDMNAGDESSYMLDVFRVSEDPPRGIRLPAVTHVDGTARVQTVDKERNPLFYELLLHFAEATGCPVLVNTSFNIRGEPIVCTPQDAITCFVNTDIDILVLGSAVVHKRDCPSLALTQSQYFGRYLND